jgi:predicted RNase H-like nuclease
LARIYGVDGCKNGWVAVGEDLDSGEIAWKVYRDIESLLQADTQPTIIAIDIPIGLEDNKPRTCDLEARKLLGWPRSSSVFTAPLRPMLDCTDYREACRVRQEIEGKSMSKQAYNIMPKIKEIDDLLRREAGLRSVIHEVHPEVCFYALAGNQPMRENKKRPEGHQERARFLPERYADLLERAESECAGQGAAPDDILDAFAALWSAGRISRGEAISIPATPPIDRLGLPMKISY